MAVIYEPIEGTELIRAYSDKKVYIHGGKPEADYVEAIDPVSLNRKYTETEIPIEDEDEGEGEVTPTPVEPVDQDEATIEDYQEALEKLGVSL